MGAAAAIPAITQAVGAVTKLLFAAHTARLKGATNENAALDQVIPAWDTDVQYVADAFNQGQATETDCINALITIDSQVYQYLKGHVGAAGTAWTVAPLGTAINAEYHADCNKSCTAGCCVYNNDLRPAIFGRNNGGKLLNGGLIAAIKAGNGQVAVPGVAAPPNSAYGNYSRPSYSIAILKPKFAATATVESLLGFNSGGIELPAPITGTSPQVAPGNPYGGGFFPSGPTSSYATPPSGNLKGFAIIAAIFLALVLIIGKAAR